MLPRRVGKWEDKEGTSQGWHGSRVISCDTSWAFGLSSDGQRQAWLEASEQYSGFIGPPENWPEFRDPQSYPRFYPASGKYGGSHNHFRFNNSLESLTELIESAVCTITVLLQQREGIQVRGSPKKRRVGCRVGGLQTQTFCRSQDPVPFQYLRVTILGIANRGVSLNLRRPESYWGFITQTGFLIESQQRQFYHLTNSKGLEVTFQGQGPAESFMILIVIGLEYSESRRPVITRRQSDVWSPCPHSLWSLGKLWVSKPGKGITQGELNHTTQQTPALELFRDSPKRSKSATRQRQSWPRCRPGEMRQPSLIFHNPIFTCTSLHPKAKTDQERHRHSREQILFLSSDFFQGNEHLQPNCPFISKIRLRYELT